MDLDLALQAVGDTEALVCCGDLCSPFIVHQLARGFPGPIHVVFGNNDADLYRITSIASRYSNVRLHGELMRTELDGKTVGAQHFDYIARPLAVSAEFDVVSYGHNHVHDIRLTGRTLAVNPGSIMGATFSADGSRTDVAPTFVVYDTATGIASGFEIAGVAPSSVRHVRPIAPS